MSTFNPIFYYNLISQVNPLSVNQVAYFPFDNSLINSINGVTATGTAITYGVGIGGIANTAVSLNGTTSEITVADLDIYSFGNGSVNAPNSINIWFYYASGAPTSSLYSKRSGNTGEYELTFISGGQLQYQTAAAGTFTIPARTVLTTNANSFLTVNAWNMVTIVDDGNNTTGCTIYVNANLCTSTTTAGSNLPMNNTITPLYIGRSGGAAPRRFGNRLDNFRIWKNRQLTGTEISNIYSTLY
jgi:hypothetical protein